MVALSWVFAVFERSLAFYCDVKCSFSIFQSNGYVIELPVDLTAYILGNKR